MVFLATHREKVRDYGQERGGKEKTKKKREREKRKRKVVVTGIEPMTFGLLDQRSTN